MIGFSNSDFGESGFGFPGFFSVFFIFFFLIFGIILVVIIKGILQWNKNNHSPVLTVNAKIVAKRSDIHHHRSSDSHSISSSSTSYYTTFEVESGDRMELSIPDDEFGYLVEGDNGKLTFQGTRFKKFERYR